MTTKPKKKQLRLGIIGMGPIGQTLTAHLIDAGAFVAVCDIDRSKIDVIKEKGICLERMMHKQVKVAEACYSADELEKYNLDLIVISVKASYLKNVVATLSKASIENSFIMCAQNGLDNERVVSDVFGKDRTLRMVINYAGLMSALNTVQISFFNAPNYVAAMSPKGEAIANTIAELLSSVNVETEAPGDISSFIWEKSILNSAMAPCAIAQLTMKTVMDSPETVKIVKATIDESVCVAEAEGIKFREDFSNYCIKYLKAAGHHRTSMAVDLANGRLTEIDYLNGRIAWYGRKHGIPTPLNWFITVLIQLMEQQRDESSKDRE